MDMKHIQNNMLIERYLQGALTREESEAFEEAFLSSPELLDQLEAAERLQQGLKDVRAVESEEARHEKVVPLDLFRSPRRAMAATMHSPRYAMVATLFLAVTLVASGTLYRQNQSLLDLASTSDYSAVQIVTLETVRGAANDDPFNVVDPGVANGQIVLLVDPGFEPYSHFRATVIRLEDESAPQTVFQLDKLQPDYEDMLALGVPASRLTPGDYEVRVEGWRSEWPANQEFEPAKRVTFRVR